MGMRKILLVVFVLMFVSCKNNYKDVFFEPIFGIKEITLNLECGINDGLFDGQGRIIEKYSLPNELLDSFYRNYHNFPEKSKYSDKYTNVINWKNTPIPNIYRNKFIDFPPNKCLGEEFLKSIDNPNNLYCSYYTVEGEYYTFFVIDKENSLLYVIEETW